MREFLKRIKLYFTEQWRSFGYCRFCRKRKYCGTVCTRKKSIRKVFQGGR